MNTNISMKDEPTAGKAFIDKANEMGKALDQIREILDPETMNNIHVILESIQEARDAYPGLNSKFNAGSLSLNVVEAETLLAKIGAIHKLVA